MKIGEQLRFDYTSDVQEVILPTGQYKFECWGAQGGGNGVNGYSNSHAGVGGKGGYSKGIVRLRETQTFYVYVGGSGFSSSSGIAEGGWNGGGCAWATSSSEPACGGGGATDVRIVGGVWDLEAGLYSRIVVAGGGGGGGEDSETGGFGGGETGGYVSGGNYVGTQSSTSGGAVFGKGAHTNYDGGGGGGGWYGGGTAGGSQNKPTSNSTTDTNGASGGSGYVLTEESHKPEGYIPTSEYYMTNNILISGNLEMPSPFGDTQIGQEGNGYCIITCLDVFIYAKCKIDGQIKQVNDMKIKVNGSWKNVTKTLTKVNGIWK